LAEPIEEVLDRVFAHQWRIDSLRELLPGMINNWLKQPMSFGLRRELAAAIS
jgi:hypothetical protein